MAREIIYFSRHGETDWNVSQRIQGQLDIDINDNGRSQADRNGDMLKSLIGAGAGFDFVASPLRARAKPWSASACAWGWTHTNTAPIRNSWK